MIRFKHRGDFRRTERYLKNLQHKDIYVGLDELGRLGVEALASATPVDSGLTAQSWTYQIHKGYDKVRISWENTNVNDGVNIAIILQYGHASSFGGFVEGKDYINPAIQPIFDMIAENVWKEVTAP